MDQFTEKTKEYFKINIDNIPPKNSRSILFDFIKPFLKNGFDVLDTNTKTGEFINDLQQFDVSMNIIGLEKNKHLYDNVKDMSNCKIYNTDILHLSSPYNFKKFDLVLGAPPSFFVDKKTEIGNKFKHWFVNKTDIYSFYFMRAIDLLRHNGYIAFILPESFLNSQYLQLLRNKVYTSGSILKIQRLSNLFTKTTYNTIFVAFQKTKNIKDDHIFRFGNTTFFTCDFPLYKSIFDGATTLHNLRAVVKPGTANTNLVRTHNIDCIPIIYKKNIEDHQLQLFKNNKQYIDPNNLYSNILKQPSLLFFRFIGDRDNDKNMVYSLCTLDKYICNVNLFVITFPDLYRDNSVMLIHSIIKSLQNDKTKTWIKHFIKDGTISKYQLMHYLPIFL
tara:strand:+ start:440 stop:1606 length:1167 start_codon:yes stop_codon:yes gene_type:complete